MYRVRSMRREAAAGGCLIARADMKFCGIKQRLNPLGSQAQELQKNGALNIAPGFEAIRWPECSCNFPNRRHSNTLRLAQPDGSSLPRVIGQIRSSSRQFSAKGND